MEAMNVLGRQTQTQGRLVEKYAGTCKKCPGCGRSESVRDRRKNEAGNCRQTYFSGESFVYHPIVLSRIRGHRRDDLRPTSYWWTQIAGSGGSRLNRGKQVDRHEEKLVNHFHFTRQLNVDQQRRRHWWRRNYKFYLGSTEESSGFSRSSRHEMDNRLRNSNLGEVLVSSPLHPKSEDYRGGTLPNEALLHDNREVSRVQSCDSKPENEEIQVHQVELPTLQVQSREEQEKLAATPAHPKALHALYGSFFFNCFIEHTWRFACPSILSLLHHSLLPVAVFSFAGQLVIFGMGPWVGEMMDRAPRVLALNVLSVVQATAMLISAVVTLHALKSGVTSSATAVSLFKKPWFIVLVIAGAVERLMGLASGVAFERDWVVQLAGANRPLALAKANASVRRVDLFCEISGPLIFGWLLSKYPATHCVKLSIIVMLISLPVLLSLVKLTDICSSGVLQRPRHSRTISPLTHEDDREPKGEVAGGLSAALKGWREYVSQPVLPASIAYVLLYFNAVLSPGGLMTSFLTQRGLDVSIIGMFRGACAAMGFFATFISAPLIARIGVLKAGGTALAFQAFVLLASIMVYVITPPGNYVGLMFFLSCVVLSRLGQWTYDVVDAQIFQTAIPAAKANLVGTTEISLASLAELIMLAVAIVVHDVKHFGSLAFISMLSVLMAAAIYWRWLLKPNADQKRLFPNEPHFRLGLGLDSVEPGLQPLVPPTAV